MAAGPRHYVAPILKELCTNTFKGIAKMICAGNRPSAGKEKDDFIVVRTSSRIGEHKAFQQMSLYVEIYVRNVQGGFPNMNRLQQLEEKVVAKFPMVYRDKPNGPWRWKATDPMLQISGDDQLGFSVWLVRASLQVNTTDRFAI